MLSGESIHLHSRTLLPLHLGIPKETRQGISVSPGSWTASFNEFVVSQQQLKRAIPSSHSSVFRCSALRFDAGIVALVIAHQRHDYKVFPEHMLVRQPGDTSFPPFDCDRPDTPSRSTYKILGKEQQTGLPITRQEFNWKYPYRCHKARSR